MRDTGLEGKIFPVLSKGLLPAKQGRCNLGSDQVKSPRGAAGGMGYRGRNFLARREIVGLGPLPPLLVED